MSPRIPIAYSCAGFCFIFVFSCVGSARADDISADVRSSGLDSARPDQIEVIQVTANKRPENLQDVPISITSITRKQAVDFGATETDQLSALVPGLQIQHEINETTTFIRGVGPNSNQTGEESSVSVYLDDLYIEQGDSVVFSLNGISDIDVLKGPQGTLFGRNATAGVIQVHTQDPSFAPIIDAHVGYGSFDTKSGDLYVSGPIKQDVLAANLSLYQNLESAGWGRDVLTGQRAFSSNDWAVRAKLLYTPTLSTRVLLSLNHFYTRGEEGLGFNQVSGYIAAGAPLLTTNATFVGWYNTEDTTNDVSAIKHDLIELRVDQDMEFATLTEIAGWQQMHGYAQFDQDASPEALVDTHLGKAGRDWSNEFRVSSPSDATYSRRLSWIAGLYYLHDDSGYDDAALRGATYGFPVTSPPGFGLILNDNVRTVSIAPYGQVTAQVLSDTSLTLGARYTHDNRIFTGGLYFSPPIPVVGGMPACIAAPLACPTANSSPGANHSWNLMTYRASLTRHIAKDVMAYFSFNRGAKSGEFDTFATAAAGPLANPPVSPETIQAFEVGVKSEWLEHHIRLNLAAFHYNVSNLQIAVIVPGGTQLVNAAGAQINGGEAETVVKVVPNLTISSSISLQYGYYTKFPDAPAYFTPPTDTINAAGLPTVHTPHFTGSLAADYRGSTSNGDFDLNINFTHTDKFEFLPDQSLQQPATNIVNTSLLWTEPRGRFDVRLWGANITGQKYYSFGSESLGLGKQFSPAPPATFGVSVGIHLGRAS